MGYRTGGGRPPGDQAHPGSGYAGGWFDEAIAEGKARTVREDVRYG